MEQELKDIKEKNLQLEADLATEREGSAMLCQEAEQLQLQHISGKLKPSLNYMLLQVLVIETRRMIRINIS